MECSTKNPLDIENILKALDNETNDSILNLTTKKINEMNLKILKELHLTKKDVFTIWNFSLDDVNTEENYGVYANGLLVEACPYADMINPKFPIVFKE